MAWKRSGVQFPLAPLPELAGAMQDPRPQGWGSSSSREPKWEPKPSLLAPNGAEQTTSRWQRSRHAGCRLVPVVAQHHACVDVTENVSDEFSPNPVADRTVHAVWRSEYGVTGPTPANRSTNMADSLSRCVRCTSAGADDEAAATIAGGRLRSWVTARREPDSVTPGFSTPCPCRSW